MTASTDGPRGRSDGPRGRLLSVAPGMPTADMARTVEHYQRLGFTFAVPGSAGPPGEAGFAMASEGDFAAIATITQAIRKPRIASLARAKIEDIEMAARALYEEAATHCHSVRDYVSRDLFEKLMHDEEEHIDFLETQLGLIRQVGEHNYLQSAMGELEG